MYELGLLSSGPNIGLHFPVSELQGISLYELGETAIYVTTAANSRPNSVAVLTLTKIGLQLSALIPIERNEENIKYACKVLYTPYTKIVVGRILNAEGHRKVETEFEYKP